MGYEGFIQRLCKKGHYETVDVYVDDMRDGEWACSKCGESCAWSNQVDTTNGDDWPVELEVSSQKVCEHCDSVLETIFYIPQR